jgi:Uma2 family endonuclease
MALELKRRRFTVEEYHWMARAGILGEDDRVELIEGEIVEVTPIGHRHAVCVNHLNRAFSHLFDDVAVVSVQNPVHVSDYSEPEPDVALLRPPGDSYLSGHPRPKDILLIVEVAETSADPDRRAKVPLYARSGIQEVWLVDLEQHSITAYRDPTPDGYRSARVFRRGESISPAAFPDRALGTADLLPE